MIYEPTVACLFMTTRLAGGNVRLFYSSDKGSRSPVQVARFLGLFPYTTTYRAPSIELTGCSSIPCTGMGGDLLRVGGRECRGDGYG